MESVRPAAVAGFAGTKAMSAVMLALKKAGMVPGEVEPKEVAENVEEALGARSLLSGRAFEASWVMFHFGYGSTSGVAYAVTTTRLDRPVLAGALFGMFLRAAGYCGWLPLHEPYSPPAQVPKRKVAVNILTHGHLRDRGGDGPPAALFWAIGR